MKEELTVLFNTLCQIETRGDSTLKMSSCLQHVQQMIAKCEMQKNEQEKEKTNQAG